MKVIFLSQKSHCVKYTRTRDFADPFQYKARICRFYAFAYPPPPVFSVIFLWVFGFWCAYDSNLDKIQKLDKGG